MRTIATAVLWLAMLSPASAMTMHVIKDQAILTGPVVPGDVADFETLLAANPDVKNVVLWNSPGGAFVANRGLTKLITEHKLDTAVAGHCVFACRGPRPNLGDYGACNPIANTDALSMGVITSTDILHMER